MRTKIHTSYLTGPKWLNPYLPLLTNSLPCSDFLSVSWTSQTIPSLETANTVPLAWNVLPTDLFRTGAFSSFWSQVKYHSLTIPFKVTLHPTIGHFLNHYRHSTYHHLISLSYLYICLLCVFLFKKVGSIKAKALYTAVSSAARIVPHTEEAGLINIHEINYGENQLGSFSVLS